ncbi:MAG: hypothetical protein H7Y06_04310 [Opitutaceae bacterium]|nr:hypothetical protein [Opitutaceae bacterium]
MATRTKKAPAPRQPMPQATPRPALPKPVESALASVRAAKTRTILGEGAGRLILLLIGLLVAQGLLDWGLELSRSARIALLVADAVAMVVAAHRWLVLPWRKRYGDNEAALAIQRTWPALGTRVIAAVQLVRPEAQGSRLLINQVIAETGRLLAPLQIGKVVSGKRAQRLMLGAVAGSIALGSLVVFGGVVPSTLFKRILLSNLQLPTNTMVVPVTEDLKGSSGGDFQLSARATGVIPAQASVKIIYHDGQKRTFTAAPQLATLGVFSLSLTNVQQSFSYQFYMGDGHGLKYDVTVRPAPLLTKVVFDQTYPAYTGRPKLSSGPGPLTLFAGSVMRITIHASSPLSLAHIQLTGEEPIQMLISSADNTTAVGEFKVPTKPITGLSIGLVDDKGIPSTGDTVYPVKIELDAAPVIKVLLPQNTEETMLAAGSLPIRVHVTDDFGLRNVELVTESRLNPSAPPLQERLRLQPGNGGIYNATLTPATLNPPWPDDTTGNWWIEASDNNDTTGTGITSSPHYQISILSPAAKRQELLEKINAVSGQIDEIAKRQQDARETIEDFLKKAKTSSPQD